MNRSTVGALFLLILLGAFLRIPQINYGSPVVRDPDSIYTVGAARQMVENRSFDPKSYFYPTCYTNILAGIAVLTGERGLEEKARALSVAAMLGAVVVTFFIARALAGPAAGLMASLFISLGFLFVKQGIRPAPDSLQLLFVACSLLFLVRRPTLAARDAGLSGLFAGFAVGAKFVGVLFVAPLLGALLLANFKSALKPFFFWAAASLAGFFISSPQFFLQAPDFIKHMIIQRQIQKGGGLDLLEKKFWDLLFHSGTNVAEFPFRNSLAGEMGLPFVMASMAAVLWSFKTKEARFVGLGISAIGTYAYFALGSAALEVRYLLPWALVTSALIAAALVRFPIRGIRIAVALGLLAPSVNADVRYLSMLKKDDSRLLCAQWILGNVPAGAKVLNFMLGPALPAGRFDMVQWTFPEYVYELPDSAHKGPTLRKLRAEGIEWVIWNDVYTHKFIESTLSPNDFSYIAEWRAFYDDLNHNASVKQVFAVENGLGPNLEVFRVPS